MRPSLRILDDELMVRIVDEAMRVLAEVGMEIRGPEMKPPPARARPAARPQRRAGPVPAGRRRGGDRLRARRRSRSTTAPASPTPSSAATTSTSCPARPGLKVLDHRTGETRLADSTDFIEYVRLADGLGHIAYLATAFSTNNDIEAQVSRRVAPVHDPDELEQAGRVAARSPSTASRGWSR